MIGSFPHFKTFLFRLAAAKGIFPFAASKSNKFPEELQDPIKNRKLMLLIPLAALDIRRALRLPLNNGTANAFFSVR